MMDAYLVDFVKGRAGDKRRRHKQRGAVLHVEDPLRAAFAVRVLADQRRMRVFMQGCCEHL